MRHGAQAIKCKVAPEYFWVFSIELASCYHLFHV
jgi:hypothetical protein